MGRKQGPMSQEEKVKRWPGKYRKDNPPPESGCRTISIPISIIPKITTDTFTLDGQLKWLMENHIENAITDCKITFIPDKDSMERTAKEIRDSLSQALKCEEVSPFEALWYIADMQKAILEELRGIREEQRK